MDRFGNVKHRMIDWYQPLKRHVEPIENTSFPLKTTSFDPATFKSVSRSFSNSRVEEDEKKVT